MNIKERIIKLLESVPDYKMDYILAYIQGLIADETLNDKMISVLKEVSRI